MFADPSGRSIILTGLAAKAATALGVLVTPIIAKGIADGLKATADLLDSGIQAIADLFSSSDDKSETVTVSPAPTIEDIENNILTFEERRPFSTFFPDSPSNNLSVIFRTPTEGEPNTDLEIKGPKDSRTVRHFGPDGKAEYDIDYWHPGAKHEFPHRHDWNWNNKISPRGKGYKIIINK